MQSWRSGAGARYVPFTLRVWLSSISMPHPEAIISAIRGVHSHEWSFTLFNLNCTREGCVLRERQVR